MAFIRVDSLLTSRGFGSRKEALALIKEGAVLVNGRRAVKGGQKFDADSAVVTVRGVAVDLRARAYLMLHKPKGVVCAARDSRAKTVMDLIPEPLRRRGMFPVGRLDKDTTGLLLITDDGALAHRLLAPRRHVAKVYVAVLQSPARREDAAAFATGMRLPAEDGHPPEDCLPARLEPLPHCRARVTLHEGKYHQIKRMFRATGNKVLELRREAVGALALDETLAVGECRALTEKEIAALRADDMA